MIVNIQHPVITNELTDINIQQQKRFTTKEKLLIELEIKDNSSKIDSAFK